MLLSGLGALGAPSEPPSTLHCMCYLATNTCRRGHFDRRALASRTDSFEVDAEVVTQVEKNTLEVGGLVSAHVRLTLPGMGMATPTKHP